MMSDSKPLFCERCYAPLDEDNSVRDVNISVCATGSTELYERYTAKALCEKCYGMITEHVMKFMLGLE